MRAVPHPGPPPARGEREGPAPREREGPTASAPKDSRRYPERPIVGVLAVVLRDGKALVVRRTNPPLSGRWGFPGGVLELGETVAAGAMRELREETGVVAEPAGTLTVLDSLHRDDDGRVRYHYVLVAVLGIWKEGEGTPGDDADEVAWLSRAEIIEQGPAVAPATVPLIDLAAGKTGC